MTQRSFRRGERAESKLLISKPEQPFATPDSHDPYLPGVPTIDDAKRWMNQLPQKALLKLGHDPSHFRMGAQRFDPLKDFSNEAVSDMRHFLFGIPVSYGFQVGCRRFGEANGNPGHPAILRPGAP